MIILWLFFVFTTNALTNAATEDDEHYSIVRVQTRTDEDKDSLRRLDDHMGYRMDYLRAVRKHGQPADMIVREKDLPTVKKFLAKRGIWNKIVVRNTTKSARRARRNLMSPVNGDITLDLIQTKYLGFDDQMAMLHQLGKRYPSLTRVWQIATSSEGRPMYAIKIGSPSNSSKPILWIDGGIHAREWISHSAALYIIWQFIHDISLRGLLKEMDIIVVPNTNPDGYEYSRLRNRMWRKTRSKTTASRFSEQCTGVDANRNYPFHFGEEGVSHWPCQETYCGQAALSEPEVMGLVSAILERKDKIRGYIALHSFGQDILYPWGHTVNEYPPDVEELKSMAHGIAFAIRTAYGTTYSVSNSADGLYPASGAADDWAKSIGIKYAFTFELSPAVETNHFVPGFVLSEAHISRVTREVMRGVEYMARRLRQEEVASRLNDIISSRPIRRRYGTRRTMQSKQHLFRA
ncbi:hypothetical protein Q1695_002293 [Nippostrongylus brasiliensis]|nr:hypothetical protein Q1695_002293 [Nippostrongylus brasiliensis]